MCLAVGVLLQPTHICRQERFKKVGSTWFQHLTQSAKRETYAFLFHLISLCRSFTDRDSRHGLRSFFGKISPSESFRGARVVTVAIVGMEPDSET